MLPSRGKVLFEVVVLMCLQGLLQKYQQEIKTLKEELAVQSLLHHDNKSGDQLTHSQVIALQRDVKLYMEGTLSTLEVRLLI